MNSLGLLEELLVRWVLKLKNLSLVENFRVGLATLTELAKSKALPSNEELEMLWFQLLQEMNAQGEVKHFHRNHC